ncbi:Ger(x)C family spore germination protein [Paenibacillus faecis]|uniref:Ger(X)C family spore germination protein n=1 Tax=Paenibacillus faecis TaxID=862114 RepID=A0A5D0D3Y7_9BACL|nr:Ger(x)C family spore germination protein [Paenibacillus faecis]TYA15295.1 Ger(x)C family spore germination protein [Paenibacillus faecis]
MRKGICCLIAIVLLVTLTGCQFKDIDKRSFVLAIGVDRPEDPNQRDQYEVTLKMAIPEGDPTKRSQEAVIITEIAKSVPEAIRLIKSKIDKEPDFSHCKVMVFGESFARDNIVSMTDWTARRRDIQLIMYVAVGKPSAKEVVNMQTKSERLPGNALILSLGTEGTESPFITTIYSFDLHRRVNERGMDPLMPVVEAKKPDMLVIDKVALFDKKKMVSILSPDETRMLNLLRTRNLRTSFHIEAEGQKIDYNLESSRPKYRIKTGKNGKAVIAYKLSGKAMIETNEEGAKMDGLRMKEASKTANKRWEEDSMKLLKKVQSLGVDPFGWGLRYTSRNWNNNTELKQWQQLYPEAEFQVKANVKIQYSGMIR